jgi:uncharacterized protein (TIGR00369 family)
MTQNVIGADKLNERLTAAPFNKWMGLSVLALDEDKIEIGLVWREEMVSNPAARYTHGGILGALIDTASDFAVAAKVGAPVPTVDMRVDYHRAAKPGNLKAVARVIRLGGTNSVAEALVYDLEGNLIASGRGVYFTAAAKA